MTRRSKKSSARKKKPKDPLMAAGDRMRHVSPKLGILGTGQSCWVWPGSNYVSIPLASTCNHIFTPHVSAYSAFCSLVLLSVECLVFWFVACPVAGGLDVCGLLHAQGEQCWAPAAAELEGIYGFSCVYSYISH